MDAFFQAIIAVLAVSAVSLIGVVTVFYQKSADRILFLLVSFSAGGLLGAAFFDLLPEAIEQNANAFALVFIGFVAFFVLEKFLYWHHHHVRKHAVEKQFVYLNLIGDGIHNFFDGVLIAAAFMQNAALGVSTTIAVIFHEIPQEIGDFGLLIYGGLSKKRALLYNFLTALTAVVGCLAAFFFSAYIQGLPALVLPFAAGGFIYVAATDLIPELHKETDVKKSFLQLVAFLAGASLLALLAG
ncbi:MAG: ZIP family metal transporter [Candidatus Micrarchaeota archaeon]